MKQSYFYEPDHDRADVVEFFSGYGHTLPHFHRCIEIIYITKGAMRCEIDGKKFLAEKDDIVFSRKCAVHELIPAPDYKNHVLIIGQSYSDDFSSIFQKRTLPAHLCDRAFNKGLLHCFVSLGKAVNGEDFPGAELVKKGYIDVIIGSLLGHYERVPTDSTPALGTVVKVLNYIDEHFREPISLDTLSSAFGYNKYYFSRLFNRYIGETLNSYVNMVRVRSLVAQAQREESPRLASLVFDCGFDSMTTFYRSFSRYYDCPPTELFKKHG